MSSRKLWIPICLVFAVAGFLIPAQAARKKITVSVIAAAEKLIGLNFSNADRKLMLKGVEEQLTNYQDMRKIKIENWVPPSLFFHPLPHDFRPPSEISKFHGSEAKTVDVPENLEDLAFASVNQLAWLIRNKKVTSEQLTRMYLQRLKRYDPDLKCVVTLTEELALEQARRADQELAAGKYRGPLHGIPYGAKDLLSVKGIRTTWGSVPYKEQVFAEDATVIKRLEEAGAVLVAKLSVGELAWGDVWFGGMTRNPWNKEKGSSGSSAGSAAAIAAGLVPFAVGTETWGSIVSPSTTCGVTGLRPTYGRVSRYGAMALSWSMDKIGPMCRYVEDCALVFKEIYGPDGKDEMVYDFPFYYDADLNFKNLRIGYLKKDFENAKENRENDRATLEKLKEMGAELVSLELPDFPISALSIILSAEAAAAFDELTRKGKDDLLVRQVEDAWPNVFRISRFIPAVEYIQANRIRYLLIQEMERKLKDIDVYVAPSLEGDNLLLTNLTGHPCVVVPNGFDKEGLPTSISFHGKLFDEGKVLAVAKKYQEATDFHLKRPKL